MIIVADRRSQAVQFSQGADSPRSVFQPFSHDGRQQNRESSGRIPLSAVVQYKNGTIEPANRSLVGHFPCRSGLIVTSARRGAHCRERQFHVRRPVSENPRAPQPQKSSSTVPSERLGLPCLRTGSSRSIASSERSESLAVSSRESYKTYFLAWMRRS